MNQINALARVFSHCDQSHVGCDQRRLKRFVWPYQPDEACL
jgi:hypothetical protein